jgi:imidazole glycerol-phosphate synthase subunit HisH
MISIVNYGSGNIRAIGNIYDKLRIPYNVAETAEEIARAEKIILPGVGAFDETMSKLNESGLREILHKKVVEEKKPVLGICVGMQILAKSSDEGSLPGLGWIDGIVRKFDVNKLQHVPKLPHLGWNSIEVRKNSVLFQNIDFATGFYFIHTYYFSCNREQDILSTTSYGDDFVSAVNHENIYGTQFHPEKSHSNGVELLKNFATQIC